MSESKEGSLSLVEPRDFFSQLVSDAFEERNFETYPHIRAYLVDLLSHFLFSDNLWIEKDKLGRKTNKMLAETLMEAQLSDYQSKIKQLKTLGDRSLYMSGFFSDSFQRKIIDVDYYAEMGATAYESLASAVEEDTFSALYSEMAKRFLDLVDVLSVISGKAMLTDDENLLRILEVYSKTGSPHLENTLVSKGFFNSNSKSALNKKQ